VLCDAYAGRRTVLLRHRCGVEFRGTALRRELLEKRGGSFGYPLLF
jgi:hypothetical protein